MDSVIIFRATPKQKAEMIKLIKSKSSEVSTLAIGDGANDVNMITSAHVGVGIIGEEGKQAARASDYSISQFSYLKKLLLFHGREFYRKNTYVICYNFFKNCLFVIPQFWFGFFSMFSGQTMYDKFIYQLYNFLYTSFPIVYYGVYDKEFEPEFLLKSEKHYIQGIIGKLFHAKRFWKWVLTAFFQGLLIVIFHNYSFLSNQPSGFTQSLWSLGSMYYSSVVLIVNLRLLFSTNNLDVYALLLIFGSIFLYYLSLLVMNFPIVCQNFNNFYMIMNSLNFYLSSLLICVLAYITDNGIGTILRQIGLIKDPLDIKKNEIYKYTNIPASNKNDNGHIYEFTDSYKKVVVKEN